MVNGDGGGGRSTSSTSSFSALGDGDGDDVWWWPLDVVDVIVLGSSFLLVLAGVLGVCEGALDGIVFDFATYKKC
jgi:hypothetical protein